jgi:hypothetical protein
MVNPLSGSLPKQLKLHPGRDLTKKKQDTSAKDFKYRLISSKSPTDENGNLFFNRNTFLFIGNQYDQFKFTVFETDSLAHCSSKID